MLYFEQVNIFEISDNEDGNNEDDDLEVEVNDGNADGSDVSMSWTTDDEAD